jgi:Mg2+ and Co2+ transporter CorA
VRGPVARAACNVTRPILRFEEGLRIATTKARGSGPGQRRRTVASERPGAPEERTATGHPGPDGVRSRIRLFDADRTDHELTLDEAIQHRPTGRQLLWIDLCGEPSDSEAGRIATAFELDDAVRDALAGDQAAPAIALHGAWFGIRVAAEPDGKHPERVTWLDIVAGSNLVVTRHTDAMRFLDQLDERIERDTTLGNLDAAAFVASLLDSAVTTYLRAIDTIEDDADRLDTFALRDDGRRALLADLVAVRQRVAQMRRLLAQHRDVFASLGAADAGELTGDTGDAEGFKTVATRFESAMTAVDDAREAVLGSFDIYMTRTAQRTNDIMKVLALATVLLLPGSLIAGLLGMNVIVPLDKDDPMSFWLVLTGVAALAFVVLAFARKRGWL